MGPHKTRRHIQKLMDVSKLHSLGWKEKLSLEEGIRQVYATYIA